MLRKYTWNMQDILSEEMYIAGAPGNIHSFLQVMELSPK
jgi:hypothetical protein